MININFIDDDYTDNRTEQVNEWVDGIGHEFQKSVYFNNLLPVMSRKISTERSTFEAFSSVMENFLCWYEENHYLINTENLREHIHKTASEMISRSQNSKYWDVAKLFVMSGFSKVNSDDFKNKKVEDNGHGVKSITIRRSHEKIDRNDTCSCGSGKKYKKYRLLAANS